MKLLNLNELLTLTANIAVVAGIIFLGIELQQNTAMTRAQTRDAMTQKQMDFYSRVIDDSDVAKIWTFSRADSFPYESDSVEYARYAFLILTQLRMWENEFYQYQEGLFDSVEFESRLALWERTLEFPVNFDFWEGQKYSFASEFVDFMDSEVVQR
jgi:hypothetical protein